ncbi:sigma-54-dependent Fis family transcriptional regulator, partial [bacterium]
ADLNQRVQDDRFREDLWYRLRVLELDLPPVRDRCEDILPLLRHFLCMAEGRHVDLSDYFDLLSLEAAERWEWPGNVREIAMAARRAQMARRSGSSVRIELVGRDGKRRLWLSDGRTAAMAAASGVADATPRDLERDRIRRVLDECRGSRSLAAARLGVSRSTLYRRLEKLGLPTRKP